MIKIFIGFDAREVVAFNVLAYSIIRHSSVPVSITPLCLSQLKRVFKRERDLMQSTDFAFSRFLAPYLCDFEGWSVFMDCDMLFRDDIAKLWSLRDERYAVQVVKHNHLPKESTKFLSAIQSRYACKNWSSLMLFNNPQCTALSPERVNTASGLQLHQFQWLGGLDQIGSLPPEWNHLVGYDAYRKDAKNVHFTTGGPYYEDYQDCDYADEWFAMRDAMLAVAATSSRV